MRSKTRKRSGGLSPRERAARVLRAIDVASDLDSLALPARVIALEHKLAALEARIEATRADSNLTRIAGEDAARDLARSITTRMDNHSTRLLALETKPAQSAPFGPRYFTRAAAPGGWNVRRFTGSRAGDTHSEVVATCGSMTDASFMADAFEARDAAKGGA